MNLQLKAEIVRRYGNQANFAMALRIREDLISRVINGRRSLKADEQARWARALGKKVEEIFPQEVRQ